MPGVILRSLIGQKSAGMQVLRALCGSLAAECVHRRSIRKGILGELPGDGFRCCPHYPIVAGESEIGSVIGTDPQSRHLPSCYRTWPIASLNSAHSLRRP